MVHEELLNLIKYHNDQGREVVLIFLGDIYHDYFKTVDSAIYWYNKMLDLILRARYSAMVIGNHEFTYNRDNPAWHLIKTIESTRLSPFMYKKGYELRGTTNYLHVPDILEFGDVRFIFNHYGASIISPTVDDKINIGLFHQDVYSKQMVEDTKATYGIDIYEHTPVYFDGEIPILEGYNYAYMGHAHLNYGKWRFKHDITGSECIVHNLSTLGRTNHKEVRDDFRERVIPQIFITDMKFVKVEDYELMLQPREESVDETKVMEQQMVREKQKEVRELKQHIKFTEDPIENIRSRLKSADRQLHLHIIDQALTNNKIIINFEGEES